MEWLDLADQTPFTTERVQRLFAERHFPWPIHQLDQQECVRRQSDQWLQRANQISKKYHCPTVTAFPSPQSMFILATDALFGPYPCSAGLRLHASRLMAQVDAPYAIASLKDAGEYKDNSAKTILLNLEAGSKKVQPKQATLFADIYRVDPAWLCAAPSAETLEALALRAERGSSAGLPTTAPRYTPSWLKPWVDAVCIALDMVRIVDREPFLTDEAFASDMLTSFVRQHSTELIAHPSRWCWLVYYPIIHTLLVRVRELTDGITESWEASEVVEAAQRALKEKKQAAQKARDLLKNSALSSDKEHQPLRGHGDSGDSKTTPTPL